MANVFFNTNLEYLRKKKGMTQTELAEKLGVTEGVVSHWELGKREPRNMKMVGKIAELFDVGADIITKDLRLENDDNELINKVKSLDDKSKKIVDNLIDSLKE